MKRSSIVRVAMISLLLLGGCGGLAGLRPPPAPSPRPAPGPVTVRLASDLPDAYEVLSGPIESYRRIRVNARLAPLLETYGQRKSGPGGAPLEVLVHLERLSTSYREIGSRAHPRVRYALATRGEQTLSDARRFGSPRTELGENDDARPERITKVVDVAITVDVRQEGRTLRSESVSVAVTEVVERPDIDHWAYDYGALIDEALRRAVAAVDAVVERALGRAGG